MTVDHINNRVIITGTEDPNLMTPQQRFDEMCHLLSIAILRILNRERTQKQPGLMR